MNSIEPTREHVMVTLTAALARHAAQRFSNLDIQIEPYGAQHREAQAILLLTVEGKSSIAFVSNCERGVLMEGVIELRAARCCREVARQLLC